jgi:hypothetical protein
MSEIVDKDIQDLRNQQFKRNLTLSSFAILGGLSGFLIARSYKSKTFVKITSAFLGATILALPIFLLTRKKYQERTKAIKEKSDLTIKVNEGKINISPNALTATKEAKVQTIVSNIEKANEQAFTKQERPKIEGYFNLLSEEDLTTWVKLSNFLIDDNVITLPENQREKYMKDKYGLDFKKTGEMMMKYMDFVMGVGTKNNTKQA